MSNDNDSYRLVLSRTVPIPPPPFLVVDVCKTGSVVLSSQKKCQKIEDDLNDFCRSILAELIVEKRSFVFSYKYLMPILQDGPNCGLAALSMVTSCLKEIIKVKDIFNYSKSKGFSNNGEMFSVRYMAEITQALIGCDVRVVENGIGDKETIISEILAGGLLLIPYDADFNHSPCKKKGHRAHWAVVCGVILEGLPPAEAFGNDDEIETKANCILHMPDDGDFTVKHISRAYVPEKIYMLARQGKSLHPAVWKYEDLKDSNENLVEFDPSRANSDVDYVLPPEGVEGGLKGKALMLKGLPRTTLDQLNDYLRILKNFSFPSK